MLDTMRQGSGRGADHALPRPPWGAGATVIALDRRRDGRRPVHTGSRSAIRALVVGGQELVRAGLRALLEQDRELVVVGAAGRGDEAAACARAAHPDVVVLDVDHSAPDPLAAMRRILATTPAASVLLLTDDDCRDGLFDALRAGARGVLSKDTDPAELVRAVRLLASGEIVLSPAATSRLISELALAPEPRERTQGPGRVAPRSN